MEHMNKEDIQSKGVCIIGTGSYLPERVMTNVDLEKLVDTSDEWIRTRTGISQRHIAADGETCSDLSANAARAALESAGISADEVDLIIVATTTGDRMLPSTACFVQDKIGAKNAFCFDIAAACSGFLYGMKVAKGMILGGTAKTVLVIGAEKLSSFLDWEDRSTCVLFGDGAGAVLFQAREDSRGIISGVMGSDGALANLLTVPAGGCEMPASQQTIDDRLHYVKMGGGEVFKNAVRCMCDAGQKVLDKAGLTIDDVACVIPHQANMRIIQAIADRFKQPIDKFFVNLDKVGNLSGGSVPVALDEAFRVGRVKKGDIVLFIVFGAGFTWGASLVEL